MNIPNAADPRADNNLGDPGPGPINDLLGTAGYYLPKTEADIARIIRHASANGLTVRVTGSGHSFQSAVVTDGCTTPETDPNHLSPWARWPDVSSAKQINISLDNLEHYIRFDDFNKRVTVDAGTNLGVRIHDAEYSNEPYEFESGTLFHAINERGWSVQDTGGITHQTVGGFLSTGSSGGSLQYSLDEDILDIRFIDGTGTTHYCSRTENKDLFDAAGVSMGLLGIIVSVTFQCRDRFYLNGIESTKTLADWTSANVTDPQQLATDTIQFIDLFGPGKDVQVGDRTMHVPSMAEFLKAAPYSRQLWWPQEGVKKFVNWHASPTPNKPNPIVPYSEVKPILGSERFAQMLGGLGYFVLDRLPGWLTKWWDALVDGLQDLRKPAPQWLRRLMSKLPKASEVVEWAMEHFTAFLLNIFVVADKAGVDGNHFADIWHHTLPMDNQMSDAFMPVAFTELWIPIEHTEAVMKDLNAFCTTRAHTGSFCLELYATKASSFWLSPAYNTPVFRVDVFYFKKNKKPPVEFYAQYWTLLRKYGFRAHWGKYLPEPYREWQSYLHSHYPKMKDFLALRDAHDPKQVFVTNYWREVLGIPVRTTQRASASEALVK